MRSLGAWEWDKVEVQDAVVVRQKMLDNVTACFAGATSDDYALRHGEKRY